MPRKSETVTVQDDYASSNESELFSDDNYDGSDFGSENEDEISAGPEIKKVATVMNKILGSEHSILSKSKRKSKELETVSIKDNEQKSQKKSLWMLTARSFPDIEVDVEKERSLKILATQGVVQLFSTIEKHKRELNRNLSDKTTDNQKLKAYSRCGKDSFMKILDRETNRKGHSKVKKEIKTEDEDYFERKFISAKKSKKLNKGIEKGGWNVLARNFYDQESNFKNWDKND